MKITLKEDIHPDADFYYREQFKIYHEPYLIWEKEIWEEILASCTVYRIELDGKYAGDIILENRRKGARYIVDFSILPDFQGMGVGKAALEQVHKMAGKLTAVTREETLNFFLKCGFVLKKIVTNYYDSGIDGYYIAH